VIIVRKGAPGALDVAVGRLLSKKILRARMGVQLRSADFACQDRVWVASAETGRITTSGKSVLPSIADRGLDRGQGSDALDGPVALLMALTLGIARRLMAGLEANSRPITPIAQSPLRYRDVPNAMKIRTNSLLPRDLR
jgi:hypothetical protein